MCQLFSSDTVVCSYSEIKITLWGHRAAAFNTDGVYNRTEAKPIIVLFVGGLMKSYQGTTSLWGSLFISVRQANWVATPSSDCLVPLHACCRNLLPERQRSVTLVLQPCYSWGSSVQCRVCTLWLLPQILIVYKKQIHHTIC